MHFRLILLFWFFVLSAYSSQEELDSLLHQDQVLQGEKKVENLIRIARAHVVRGDTMSIAWARKALMEAQAMDYLEGAGKAALFLGVAYDENNVDSAARYYEVAERIFEPMAHGWLGYCYTNLSRIYREKGWYTEAIGYGIKATRLFQSTGDSTQLAVELSNMGYTHDRMGDFPLAIDFQRRALPIALDHCNDYTIGLIYGRIGIAFDELQKYDSAHHFNNLALLYYQKAGDSAHIMQTLSNIGNTFLKQNRYQEAEGILNQAMEIRDNEYYKAVVLVNLGHTHILSGRFNKAGAALDEAIRIATDTRQAKFLSEAYFLKSELYEKKGMLEEALSYHKLYNSLNDSILNLETTRQVAEMRVRFETEQKEKELLRQKAEKEKLAKEKALTDIKVYNRNKWIIGISSVSLVLVFFGLFMLQRTRRRTQAEKDAAIIREREKGLDAVLEAQENERRRIARDLHDGIGQRLSGLKLAWQKLINDMGRNDSDGSDRLAQLTTILDETASEARNLSHRMMPRILNESGLAPAIEDMLAKSLGTAGIQYEFETFRLKERFPEKIEISIYRVVQELINNIIKHSGAKLVSAQLFTNKGFLILIVEDNGKGIEAGSKGEGHGILNIKSRIAAIRGEVSYDPGPGSGTVATVRVPIR